MCGNVTLAGRLRPGEKSALPKRAEQLLLGMLRVSQMRGAQSGGGAVQCARAGKARQQIRKCVNSKRGDLASLLTATLARAAGGRAAFDGSFIAQSHVRYATAGLTKKHEAHPFRFVELPERGPRRVWAWKDGRLALSSQPVETALTHNGDMDGMRFRGVRLAYNELGCLLERVLGVQNRWIGDSPVLAAAIELYLTRGMWLESLRLAHHLTVAPPAPDFGLVPSELEASRRRAAQRSLLASYPAPSFAILQQWECLAEEVLAARAADLERALSSSGDGNLRSQREELAQALAARFASSSQSEIPADRLLAFARAAVGAFFDNDLYIALRKLEPALDGTFGCVVTSTLEPGCLVALSRGQPLSLGFERTSDTVCIVSERAAIKVPNQQGELVFDERIDLDLCRGEIARVELTHEQPAALTLYGIADGREYHSRELVASGRLVPIRDNPYVSKLPTEATDRVDADLRALPQLLADIRTDWRSPGSTNQMTAEVFAGALLGRRSPRVLVFGITNDLWLAQQFVHNLSSLFPDVEARAVSSNELLMMSEALPLDSETLALALSQSGQDFPTLGALILVKQRLSELNNDAVFVLTGEVDSLMGQAVGQSFARGAPFSGHVFANCTGFRPSEAAVATVNATHHTLCELLLFVGQRALEVRVPKAPHGLRLTAADLGDLRARRDQLVEGQQGVRVAGKAMTRQARRWSRHVLEGVFGFAALVLLLELNLQLGLGILPSRLTDLLAQMPGSWTAPLTSALGVAGKQLDVLFYAFFAPLAVVLLRIVQGRPLFHRQGPRELLIGDTRYVHQLVWLLARKLFSLSYGFASIKPYSADCQDELIMTHEPVRGTLALIGLPDGRRPALRARSSAALMTAKQFNNSRSLAGAGAEIVLVTHGPEPGAAGIGAQLQLSSAAVSGRTAQVDILIEDMFDSWERLLAMQSFLDRFALEVSRFWPLRYDRSRTKDQVFAPTTAAPVSAAAIYQLLSRTAERYEHTGDDPLPFQMVLSDWRGSAPARKTTVWRG